MQNVDVLKFKDELESLCKKYDCEISGRTGDDGSIDVSFPKQNYVIDYWNNIIFYFDENEDLKYPIDDVIKGLFDDEESKELGGLNNIKVHCGIFTNNSSKAEDKLKEIMNNFNNEEIYGLILSSDRKELKLNNGERYIWIRPTDNSRGYRCKKAIIDREISYKELMEHVAYVCMYCGEEDIEII